MRKNFFTLLCVYFFISGCSRSDAELQEKFQHHRDHLDQLVNLVDACLGDKKEKFIWPHEASLAEKLCKDLMIPSGIDHIFKDKNGVIFLSVRERFGSGELKGYAYSLKPLSPLFLSLDKCLNVKPYEYAYKDLGDGWYLHCMNTSG